MFTFSSKANFQPSINVVPSRIIDLPEMVGTSRTEARSFPACPAVVTQCSPELLRSARETAGGQIRLASLHVGRSRFGIAMVLEAGHFAAALFDLGEENCKAMAKQAVKDGEVHLLLSAGDDFLLLVPKLTTACRQAFSCADAVLPASVADFTAGVQSIESALKRVEAWEQMGVDPSSLESITLSVCVPGLDASSELEIRSAGDARYAVH